MKKLTKFVYGSYIFFLISIKFEITVFIPYTVNFDFSSYKMFYLNSIPLKF